MIAPGPSEPFDDTLGRAFHHRRTRDGHNQSDVVTGFGQPLRDDGSGRTAAQNDHIATHGPRVRGGRRYGTAFRR